MKKTLIEQHLEGKLSLSEAWLKCDTWIRAKIDYDRYERPKKIKDLIEKHLRLAEQEYRAYLRKQTKHIHEARVICAANGHYTALSAMHKYITCDCARRVFYEAPDADVYSITCPVCDHKRIMLKGDR